MALRVRLYMTWTVALIPGLPGAPFSKLDDFYALARGHLHTRFTSYNAELRITVREKRESMAVLDLVWDVDLDGVPGAWHQPEDHARLAQAELVTNIAGYGHNLTVEIFREADRREAVDHAEIYIAARRQGFEPEKDEYPVFRPETHPDWPEADEVFVQEGVWFWCAPKTDENRGEGCGPAVGPDPVKIFAPWDPEFRELRYAEVRASA